MESDIVLPATVVANHTLLLAVRIDVPELAAIIACLVSKTICPCCKRMLLSAIVVIFLVVEVGFVGLDAVVALESSRGFLGREYVGPFVD